MFMLFIIKKKKQSVGLPFPCPINSKHELSRGSEDTYNHDNYTLGYLSTYIYQELYKGFLWITSLDSHIY